MLTSTESKPSTSKNGWRGDVNGSRMASLEDIPRA